MLDHSDDDSSAVTFWGKSDLRDTLIKALHKLDIYYAERRKNDREEAVKHPVEL